MTVEKVKTLDWGEYHSERALNSCTCAKFSGEGRKNWCVSVCVLSFKIVICEAETIKC